MSTKFWLSVETIGNQKSKSYRSSRMLPKPQSVPFSSYIVIFHQVQGHFHLDKGIVTWIESLITTQCVLFYPLCGILDILKNKKVWLLFHCKSSIVVLSIYIFAHCFTSKLKKKIKRKGKEILNKKIIWLWGKSLSGTRSHDPWF